MEVELAHDSSHCGVAYVHSMRHTMLGGRRVVDKHLGFGIFYVRCPRSTSGISDVAITEGARLPQAPYYRRKRGMMGMSSVGLPLHVVATDPMSISPLLTITHHHVSVPSSHTSCLPQHTHHYHVTTATIIVCQEYRHTTHQGRMSYYARLLMRIPSH